MRNLRDIFNKAPVPLAPKRTEGRFTAFAKQSTGVDAYMKAYGSVGTLFAIVNRTSTAVAAPSWHLYRKSADGRRVYEGQEQRVEVTRHAALDLLNKPNKFMDRCELFEITQQHLDLTGEAWWVVDRGTSGKGLPREIWPVRPDRMRPIEDADDYVSGYMYTSPDGQDIELQVSEVIFFRMPNPYDMYRGMGPVQAVMAELDSVRYSSEWNRNFFINGAEPGGIIQVDKRLDDEEFNEMCIRWDEQHKGVANAHRVAIIEQGTWIDRKFSQRDMQFVELNQLGREIIREAFGISKFMLGLVDDVNRATAEASEYTFAKNMTVPRLNRIKGGINNDLLPMFGGDSYEFDYASPVPDDEETKADVLYKKAQAVKTLIDAGYDPAEVLETAGLPPMDHEPPAPPPQLLPPQKVDADNDGDYDEPDDVGSTATRAVVTP